VRVLVWARSHQDLILGQPSSKVQRKVRWGYQGQGNQHSRGEGARGDAGSNTGDERIYTVWERGQHRQQDSNEQNLDVVDVSTVPFLDHGNTSIVSLVIGAIAGFGGDDPRNQRKRATNQ